MNEDADISDFTEVNLSVSSREPVLVIDVNTIQKQDMEVDIHVLFTVNMFLYSLSS